MVPVWLFTVRPVFGAIPKPPILTKRTDTTCRVANSPTRGTRNETLNVLGRSCRFR